MEYIVITSQDSEHQYDKLGRAITTWNEKCCSWVIEKEFEDDEINWQKDEIGITEFPRGIRQRDIDPEVYNYPDIEVTWTWDEDGFMKKFGERMKSGEESYTRTWGYLKLEKDEAINRLGHYCDFNKEAIKTEVKYNGEVIFSGKLK